VGAIVAIEWAIELAIKSAIAWLSYLPGQA
jgi:hypothetical protein